MGLTLEQKRFFDCLSPKVGWGFNKVTPYKNYKGKVIRKAAYVTLPLNKHHYLLLDLDYEEAGAAWLDESLPQPTFITVTPGSLHALYGYELETPVLRPLKHRAPWLSVNALEYFEAIRVAYQKHLCADTGYNEWNCKNPLSERWENHTFWYDRRYTLDELAKHVYLTSKWERTHKKEKKVDPTSPDARLFEAGRLWAYRNVKCHPYETTFQEAIFSFLENYNQNVIAVEFGKLEPRANIYGKSQSIAKYVWSRQNESWLSECGKERGKLGLGAICSRLTDDERTEEIKIRQEAGAWHTHAERKNKTAERIKSASVAIHARGERVTISAVAREAKVSRPTVYSHKHILEVAAAKV